MSIRSLPGSSAASYQVSTFPSPSVVFWTKVSVRYHLPTYRSRIWPRSSTPVFGGSVIRVDEGADARVARESRAWITDPPGMGFE